MIDRVAAVFILRTDGSALLQHRDDKPGLRHANLWVPPGGHAEPDESMIDCARRELLEETEYEPDDLQFVMSCERVYEDGVAYEVAYYWCIYDEMQTIVCHEGQELAFIFRSEVANYQMPTHLLETWDIVLKAATVIDRRLRS